jgi:hypothetical protein
LVKTFAQASGEKIVLYVNLPGARGIRDFASRLFEALGGSRIVSQEISLKLPFFGNRQILEGGGRALGSRQTPSCTAVKSSTLTDVRCSQVHSCELEGKFSMVPSSEVGLLERQCTAVNSWMAAKR